MGLDKRRTLAFTVVLPAAGRGLARLLANGFCAAGVTLPTSFGDAAVVGKSMLFSREAFERLGGFARVADLLAEDFVIGKMFQHGGYRVARHRVAPLPSPRASFPPRSVQTPPVPAEFRLRLTAWSGSNPVLVACRLTVFTRFRRRSMRRAHWRSMSIVVSFLIN